MVFDKLGQYIIVGDMVLVTRTYFIEDAESYKTETSMELVKVIEVYNEHDNVKVETGDGEHLYNAYQVVVVTQQLEQ